MSSNLEIPKTCTYCGNEYIAKTTVTRYCSHLCNRKHYKEIKRLEKVKAAGKIITPIREEINKPGKYLTISDSARLLGVSDRTIFRLIAKKIITASRVNRSVRIQTNELLKMKVYENIS